MLSKAMEQAAREIVNRIERPYYAPAYREPALENLEAFILSLLQVVKKDLERQFPRTDTTVHEAIYERNLQTAKRTLEQEEKKTQKRERKQA